MDQRYMELVAPMMHKDRLAEADRRRLVDEGRTLDPLPSWVRFSVRKLWHHGQAPSRNSIDE